MNTMDYLEFKNHLEHSFTQKDKAEYYRNKDMNSIRVSRERLELAGRANAIKALVKQRDQKNDQLNSLYRDMERSGIGSTKTNSQKSSVANGKRNKLENEIVALDNEILSKSKDLISVIGIPMFERFMKGTSLPTDVSYKLSHDNLEHGWFTDLFKPKHQNESKGSRAGMPTNIPTMSNKHGDAVAKRDSYADQVKRLTANLSDYQAKEAKAKQEYEFYRKKADEVRKAIKQAERYRDAAAKEALTTPEVNTTVTSAPPKYVRLPEGSRVGMPSNVKKRR